jgi:hypothetical protein
LRWATSCPITPFGGFERTWKYASSIQVSTNFVSHIHSRPRRKNRRHKLKALLNAHDMFSDNSPHHRRYVHLTAITVSHHPTQSPPCNRAPTSTGDSLIPLPRHLRRRAAKQRTHPAAARVLPQSRTHYHRQLQDQRPSQWSPRQTNSRIPHRGL